MSQSGPSRTLDFTALLNARAWTAGPPVGADPAASRHRGTPIHGIESIREPPADRPDSATEALNRFYVEEEAPLPGPPPSSCDPGDIARELRLTPELTGKAIEQIRRTFALANHPDRVAPAERSLATRRMTLANALIDQALRERRRKTRR